MKYTLSSDIAKQNFMNEYGLNTCNELEFVFENESPKIIKESITSPPI